MAATTEATALSRLDIRPARLHHNLSPVALLEHAVRRGEGRLTVHGAFVGITTPHTGRSPDDKFVVREPDTEGEIWWGKVNSPMEPRRYELLKADVLAHLSGQERFATDLFAGADKRFRLNVRVLSSSAWHSAFVHNMFIRPDPAQLEHFVPSFTVLHAPELEATPARHGTRTGTFIVLSLADRTVLIGGTRYAGELKKSIFTVMNYLLPRAGVLPMHCSANVGADGDVALFFGLSGTGKTTLSADPERALIGDDEHGWSDHGVCNFEGGNYAKTIRLSPEGEPLIWNASHRFGAILENVVLDEATRRVDFADDVITENTRSSYPIHFIPGAVATGTAGHPRYVIFLTADAFGVLPPVARMSSAQAMYHFISGYTARLAGTERGVSEPTAVFSACFGAPFLPRPPHVYAHLLGDRLTEHGVQVWLVNTGWTGGGYGAGTRLRLDHTRLMVRAILTGMLENVPTRRDPIFGLHVPQSVPGVPTQVLDPKLTWQDAAAYDDAARRLAAMFRENFARFEAEVTPAVRAAGPR